MASLLSMIEDFIPKITLDYPLPYSNILHQYATYNYIFSLSAITSDHVNDPTLYRNGDYGQLILKSGSGNPNERVSLGDYGAYDFFIDDLVLKTTGFSAGNSNTVTTGISFKVIEPYSMGLFFNAVNIATQNMGFENYIEAPLLLTIQFIGNVSPADLAVNADTLSTIEKTTRYIPIRLMKVDLSVNEGGTTYDIEAFAYNEIGHSTTYTQLKTDISISGKTVAELLQTGDNSLQVALNKRLRDQAKDEDKVPDQILIMFPKDPTTSGQVAQTDGQSPKVDPNKSNSKNPLDALKVKSTDKGGIKVLVQEEEDINKFGIVSMGFDSFKGVDTPFSEDLYVYDKDKHIYSRGNMSLSISSNVGKMTFTQGANVMDIINEVLMMSEYGRTAIMAEQIEQGRGKLMWWSIDVQSYVLDTDYNTYKTGSKPTLIVYRIIPYKMHASGLLPPGKHDPNVEELRKHIVKRYNYIYTGLNVDIRKFDIEFNMGTYQALFATKKTADQKLAHNNANNIPEPATDKSSESENAVSKFFSKFYDESKLKDAVDEIVKVVKTDSTETSKSKRGGSRHDDDITKTVKLAYDVLLNGMDMIRPNIEILGDPYYLTDSGTGNYIAQETDKENINADHSMNMKNGDVDIEVIFRTPLDIDNGTGNYNFGSEKILTQFSGIFRVLSVESRFSKGLFTQTLDCVRRPGQYAKQETSSQNSTDNQKVDQFGANENGRIVAGV